jgi:signal transduction histidine kinase
LCNEHLQYEKLKEADQIKNEFINIAAHELRTPVQPIIGLSEVLHSYNKRHKTARTLDVMVRNAKRLQRLTEDILDVTKIESHSLNLRKELFNLNDVLTNTIDDITTNIVKNNNKQLDLIKLVYQPCDIFVQADKGRITQVISNLLGNAVKFTETKANGEGRGIINIKAEKDDSMAIVSIEDTGSGIDPEIMPRLFEKFTSKSYQGIGLGLFISKSIVKAHEGTYQIVVKVNSNHSALTLASFKMVIPFQPLGVTNINYIFPLLIPAVLVGIVGAVAILSFMVIVANKRRNYKKV